MDMYLLVQTFQVYTYALLEYSNFLKKAHNNVSKVTHGFDNGKVRCPEKSYQNFLIPWVLIFFSNT